MPVHDCSQLNLGIAYQVPLPDGSGYILVEAPYTWDGVSSYPDCNGPITSLHVQNTGQMTAWALLPNKKKSPQWYQLDPGVNGTETRKGALSNLGLSNGLDVAGVQFVFTQPA